MGGLFDTGHLCRLYLDSGFVSYVLDTLSMDIDSLGPWNKLIVNRRRTEWSRHSLTTGISYIYCLTGVEATFIKYGYTERNYAHTYNRTPEKSIMQADRRMMITSTTDTFRRHQH